MAKILVTGGAGFIGSHLVDALVKRGHKVVVIDNLSTGFKANLHPRAKFYQVDICSAVIDKIFQKEKFDYLFHYAAQVDVRKSLENPILDVEVNISGSLNLFRSCQKHGIKKIIFASSGGAIYGEQDFIPANERHPEMPISPYGVAKLSVEKYLHFYKEIYKIPYVAVRYSNVYGPRQNPKGDSGVVAIFSEKLLKNEPVTIYGDGKQTRDYLYVSDAVNAALLGMKSKQSGAFNIGTARETSVNQLYRLMKSRLTTKSRVIYAPFRAGEQLRSCIDYAKAKNYLGWKPAFDLDSGLNLTLKYYAEKIK
jgi:UDP-glucose 4-epimerase